MNESLLQFIWKQALFNSTSLVSTENETINIVKRGTHNTDAGPDFLDASVKIGNTEWFGAVELHVKTSEWIAHKHSTDPKYKNVILHVVYENDEDACPDSIPVLALKPYINISFLEKYQQLMQEHQPILCNKYINDVPGIIIEKWKERLIFERFEHKIRQSTQIWKHGIEDWKQLLYYLLCVNFGFKKNQDGFVAIFHSLPLSVLEKCSASLLQLEALMFGQAGLIPTDFQDDYTQQLEKEYHFLRRKFDLVPIQPIVWKFLRLRPPNFPTVRLAQFAQLFFKIKGDLTHLLHTTDVAKAAEFLDCAASAYFDTHYRLSAVSKSNEKKHLGLASIHNILINSVAPIQYFYGQNFSKPQLEEGAVALLQEIPAEDNSIIKAWKAIGIKCNNAYDSQALLHLFNHYCKEKKCLNCSLFVKITK